ncbi:cellulose synthase subunit BcsC-related outer membrane protein [Pseudomonas agarici]|uniref:cellulose synthase subunit BcsC-related outer membrane protein n=1 Tax=Pseudomonas agarici TaxID=46677 RepID=UPI0015A4579E|nr:cellulose synthase subunit BcsC-related outer membrane protein [Pseudomonas agarici]NWB90525.1 BCSC C-terminal domain-containing protein [Pseudomonas agarici]
MRQQILALAVCAALASGACFATDPDTGSVQSLLIRQGYYWQTKEKPERATEAWTRLLNLQPEQPDALYGLGLIDVQQQRLAGAQDYLNRLQAIKPLPRLALQLEQDIALSSPDKQQRLEKARELSDAGERDKAVEAYRQLLEGHQPQGLIAREYYNTLGFATGGWPEARSGLERLRRERPDDAILDLWLALHLARNPDSRPEGIRALARLSHNPDIGGNADETWRFALVWLGPPSRDQVSLFEQYLQAHPNDMQIRALMNKGIAQGRGGSGWQRDPHVARGLQALDAGDLAGAEQALQARLKDQPGDYDALGGMGILRQQQKRLDEAQNYLVQATRTAGGGQWKNALEDVRYWILLDQAGEAQRSGRQTQARELIEQAIAKNPMEPAGPTALAGLQAQAGQLEGAEAGYRQVLARTPNYPDALSGLITVLSRAGHSDQALQLIDGLSPTEQARLAPSVRVRALRAIQVAKLAERRGDLGTAQKAYKEALADDPKNPWTRFALARVYLRNGQTQIARDLIDELLKQQPDQPDALYTSTLLSAELGEWTKAQRTLARIPAARRSADMNEMELDIRLHSQTELAVDVARRGQREESWALLSRCEPLAQGKAERLAVLASAYAEAGNPDRALSLMRGLLDKSASTPDLQLLYAGVLLKADQDAEASDILRRLQGQPMSETASKRYEDLVFLYRVKQADGLRERNDLVAAYDMLSPALQQRPNDSLAVSSLARMYAASGNVAKARQLYEPLIKADPGNAKLQLGLAEIAMQGRDYALAESSVNKALELEPGVPQTLTASARIYRGMGRTGEASRLLRKAIEIESSQRSDTYAVTSAGSAASSNPFVGLAGQRRQTTALAQAALIPPALDGPATGLGAENLEAVPAPVGRRAVPAANGGGNPFDDSYARDTAPRVGLSPAQLALDDILQDRSAYVVQGLSVRSNNSEKGLGKLTDIETPFEASIPVGSETASMALQITPVSLHSGSPGRFAQARLGTSGLESVGSQKDNGVGLAVAYRNKDEGLKADVGVSPLGFTYSTPIGGVSLKRPFEANSNFSYGVSASRRAVTDSLTSFAGSRDRRTGDKWGGVTANGVRGELGYDNQKFGAYGYGSAHRLMGHNVEDNDRFELGSGVYWYLRNTPDSILTLGLSGSALSYSENQDFYTYGHGGYFSPQTFFALGVPVSWSQRTERFTYRIKSSVGVQHIGQDSAAIFPGHRELQPNATAAGLTRYDGENKTGIGYSFNAAGEYKFGSNFFLGGSLGVDNASDYRQVIGGLYLRYTFEDMSGPMDLPVSPFGSPYSN